jgi:hypothetical protein
MYINDVNEANAINSYIVLIRVLRSYNVVTKHSLSSPYLKLYNVL